MTPSIASTRSVHAASPRCPSRRAAERRSWSQAAPPNAGTVQVGYAKPLAGPVLRDPDLLPVVNFTISPQPIT